MVILKLQSISSLNTNVVQNMALLRATQLYMELLAKATWTVVKYLISELGYDPQITGKFGVTPLHCACMYGNLHITEYFLSDCNCNPQCSANNGLTPLHFACQNGHLEVAKYLITAYGYTLEQCNIGSFTPLHAAASNGHLGIVKYLNSECNCNPQCIDKEGFTPLHYACQNGHLEVAKYLISEHNCSPEHGNVHGVMPLDSAAEKGHLAVVKYLVIELGCDPQIAANDGFTPLHSACLNGHLHVAKYLISDCNCNPQCSTKNRFTPLQIACLNGRLEVVKFLITECKCRPEHSNVNDFTPLHAAASTGHLAVVKYLIITGCNSHVAEKDGTTPLHYACLNGHLDVTQYLISDCNCDPYCRGNKGNTPLHYACENGHLEVAKYLINEHKCNPQHRNFDDSTPLHSAANNGHLAVVKYLINEVGCRPHMADKHGITPLHYACLNGHLHITKYLILDCNCDPQCSDNNGYTPMHCACQNGNLNITKYLIFDCNCNPQCFTKHGNTPLHCACLNDHLEVIKYLITEHKCNPEQGNVDGFTPLHFTATKGHLTIVKYLISELGCNPQVTENDGFTPLHYACLNGHLDITKYLILDCNCNPQCTDKDGNTPLHCASQNGHLDIAKYLITKYKCNPEHGNVDGFTPLHSAAFSGQLAVVKYLITEFGCEAQTTTKDGLNLLHFACLSGHLDIANYLISDCNCNPHFSTNKGFVALHYACQNGHLEVAKYLITEHHFSPEHGNVDGYTPLHSAASNGHLAVVNYPTTQHTCNPQCSEVNGVTPLHIACLNGHLDITKYLISDCNCNPQCSDNNGNTPLHYACQNGHLEVAKYLITECKCSPQHGNIDYSTTVHSAASNVHLAVGKYPITQHNCNSDVNGMTPLHLACLNGHLHVIKYLIQEQKCPYEHEAKVSSSAVAEKLNLLPLDMKACAYEPFIPLFNDFTPLQCACMGGNLDTVKYLINVCNCDPHHSTSNGLTAIDFAQKNLHQEIVQYLHNEHQCCLRLERVCNSYLFQLSNIFGEQYNVHFNPIHLNEIPLVPLQEACYFGNITAVRFYIEKCNYDPSTMTCGETLLHGACMMGHFKIVEYLISECGCDPMITEDDGYTPMHYASCYGQIYIVNYLICNCNCNPECSANNGDKPLHMACLAGHLDIAKYLISDCNCNPQCTDNNDFTPLHCACQNGHLEIAKYLITEHKCNPEQDNICGFSPLHSAARSGQLAVANYLITQCNCNPQCCDIDGITPLHLACASGHLHVAKYLIEELNCRHDPEAIINDEMLMKLSRKRDFPLQSMIKAYEISLFAVHLRGWRGQKQNSKKRAAGIKGITPLHLACMEGHLDTVKYLIGVDKCLLNHSTSNGFTGIDLAKMYGHKNVVSYLKNEHQSTSRWSQVLTSLLSQAQHCALELNYGINDLCISSLQKACIIGNLAEVNFYITKYNCNPSSAGLLGLTSLHIVCMMGHLEIAKFLVNECKCDPNCTVVGTSQNNNITPLSLATAWGQLDVVIWLVRELKCNVQCSKNSIQLELLACMFGRLNVLKYILSECSSQDMPGLLFAACGFGNLNIVKCLIDEYKCDPHFRSGDGATPLHFACTGMQSLLNNMQQTSSIVTVHIKQTLFHIWRAVIFPITLLSKILEMFAPQFSDKEMYMYGIVNDPMLSNNENESGDQPTNCHLDVAKYLITEHNCNPQCKDKKGLTPLHYACESGQLDIVQYFHSEKLSDLVHTAHSGDTPLHFACKYNQVEVVQFLLSTGECNPLIKNTEGQTPVEIAASPEIRKLLDHFCKGSYPLESVVKVFVLGDPLAGKSSLVQAIQSNPGFLSSLIGRFQKVKGLRQQTAGIDSFSFSSSEFGNVVIYDFAGQREFYTSHAAFLQNSSSYIPGIFILVVNIAECEDTICQSLQYWISFIQECCAHMHTETKASLIIIGSHADQLDIGSVEMVVSKIEKYFSLNFKSGAHLLEIEGVICLDCTRQSSPGLDLLHYHLEESCNSIREQSEKIDQRCYVLHKYVHKEYINKEIHGSILKSISKDLEDNPYLLPSTATELLPLFQTLHDKGQILLLKNNQEIPDSWIITNIPAILETVVGSIFAPRDFPQHIAPGSTGIVPKSRMHKAFSALNIDMIIGFLEHFEFCHRVGLNWVIQSKHEVSDTNDEYYLFPALVTLKNIPQVLHESHENHYYCGWFMHSTAKHQFFTIRLLHVLLLRLAFLFALPQDNAIPSASEVETPVLKQSCTMWKNGITWHDMNGVSTHFEVRELKTVILIMSSMKDSEIHCVRLRTQLIKTILKARKELCPRVDVEECIMEVESNRLVHTIQKCPSQSTKYSLKYLCDRISTRNASDHQDLVLVNPDGSPGKQISELLYFEPYTLLTPDLITQMFSRHTSNLILSDAFLSELAARFYLCKNILSQILTPNPRLLSEKLKMDVYSLDSLNEMSKHLKCVHILEAWMEQQDSPVTYRKLRQELDKYSIFCGRNPLDLVCGYLHADQ